MPLRVALSAALSALSFGTFSPPLQAQPPSAISETKNKSPFPDLIFADQPILNSIAREDAATLKAMLAKLEKNAAEINALHKMGYTPLSAAARTGNKELVQILLDKGAKNEAAGSRENGYSVNGNPLAMAAASGSLEVMRLLLDNGADLKAPQNQSLLNGAVQEGNKEMIDFLLQKGVSIEGNPNSGYTPIVAAVQKNLPEMVKYLIQKGAKVNPSERATYSYGGYSSPLYAAVQQGNKEMVALLVENGANPLQILRSDGRSPLSYALSNGRSDVVEAMLTKNVNINEKDARGQTILHQVLSGDGSMTKLLLDKGAKINERNDAGQTPLHLAALNGNVGPLKTLLDYKADLAATTPIGDTPLHLAVARPAVAKILLEAGANANLPNARGDLPLHVALRLPLEGKNQTAREENVKLRLALIEKSDINAKDQFGFSPLQIALLTHQSEARAAILARGPKIDNITAFFDAAARNDTEELKKLLEAKPYLNFMRLASGVTPLHIAAQWGASDAIDYLLKKGADINARDAQAATPLLRVLSPESGPDAEKVPTIVNYLVQKDADLAVLDEDDEGVLHMAVRRGSKELVSLLLNKGVQPNARNQSSQSPLDLLLPGTYNGRARRVVNGTFNGTADASGPLKLEKETTRELVALLLDKGADQTQGDTQGNTPLMRAAAMRDADIVTLLLAKGAQVNAQNNQNETALMRLASYSSSSTAKQAIETAKVLIAKGADVNLTTQYGETMLSRALNNSNKELAALLIESGADLEVTRPGAEAPIFRIVTMNDADLLALAIEKKADINVKDSSGSTPLQRAVLYGNGKVELVELLLKAGAELNAQNNAGQTALDLVRPGNNDLLQFLKEHGAKPGDGKKVK